MSNRIVVLIDMDCFYCQVECKINPALHGKPLAVVQYNTWKGGGIIAVNYEARNRGVTRHMRGDEAKQHCPEIELCRVPSVRGKADISKYRNAGREVIAVLSEFSNIVERASIDEAYIDLTDVVHERMKSLGRIEPHQLSNTFVVAYGPDNNDEEARSAGVSEWLSQVYSDVDASVLDNREDFLELAVAGVIVEEIRSAVLNQTQFHCSAGVGHNKVLAKLVCGLHKPQKQSILPNCAIPMLYSSLSIKKIRHLGGKLGYEVMDKLQCTTMLELEKFSLSQLQSHFDEKTASWLYHIARGIDNEPVNARLVSKSVGCCKRFPGKTCLASRTHVSHWVQELADEICERLEDDLTLNKRRAQLLTVSFTQEIEGKMSSCSRSTALPSYKLQDIVDAAMQVINRTNSGPANVDVWTPPLFFLGLSASKFSPLGSHQSIQQFFKPLDTAEPPSIPSTSSSAIESKLRPSLNQSYFNKLSSFQLELSRLEKRLVESFQRDIDCKLQHCAGGDVDKFVLVDIGRELKVNTGDNVRDSLRTYLKREDGGCEDLKRIEETVVTKVTADVEASLKDIGQIFHGGNDNQETQVEGKIEASLSNCDPSCSKEVDGLSSEKCLFDEQLVASNVSQVAIHVGMDAVNRISVPARIDEQLECENNLQQFVHPDLLSGVEGSHIATNSVNTNNADVKESHTTTYTRRQIDPEQISDFQSEADYSSPQIQSKTAGSVWPQKYEPVEKKQPDSNSGLVCSFNNVKSSSVENKPRDKSTVSCEKKKSYSFFETYLQRKKEKERQGLMCQRLMTEEEARQSLTSQHQMTEQDERQSLTSQHQMTEQDVKQSLKSQRQMAGEDAGTDSDGENVNIVADPDDLPLEQPPRGKSSKVLCDICSRPIDVNDLQEHQDYHFALELSIAISPGPVQSSTSRESSAKILNKKSSKRGRPSKLKSYQNSGEFKKLKTIDAFFKPGNSSLS